MSVIDILNFRDERVLSPASHSTPFVF